MYIIEEKENKIKELKTEMNALERMNTKHFQVCEKRLKLINEIYDFFMRKKYNEMDFLDREIRKIKKKIKKMI